MPLEEEINYSELERSLAASETDSQLFKTIVNGPFQYKLATAFLFLGIIVFLQVNKKAGTIDRIALSETDLAKRTLEVTNVPFAEIKIPLHHPENIISRAINSGEPTDATDWQFLFAPTLTAHQARINQANAGIAYSAVYPLKSREGGALIFSYYQYKSNIDSTQHEFMKRYAALVDQALEP